MELLNTPEVIRRFSWMAKAPRIPAMQLRWRGDGASERVWHLPKGVTIVSAAPTRFGMAIERVGDDAFTLRLTWNEVHFSWSRLRRADVMTSSLSLVLHALGTDLWDLLQQPVSDALAA